MTRVCVPLVFPGIPGAQTTQQGQEYSSVWSRGVSRRLPPKRPHFCLLPEYALLFLYHPQQNVRMRVNIYHGVLHSWQVRQPLSHPC
jgi:hypothetical protein